ncbi:hypothetical protein Cni_G19983 [Canna indica]|uniref:Transcription repressor n=1 Tax=Canna indica TaxID=4628 RepID=A0AAQ3QJ15_9LILI|nr:hypothetical protein Cni_G19983 [Canna indica]
MPSGRRRFLVRHPVVVDIGCGCRRPKLPSFFSFSQKLKPPKTPSLLSSSTTTSHWETSFTATTATGANSSSPSRYDDYTSSSSPAFYPPETPKKAPARGQRKPSKKKNKSMASAAAARKGLVDGSVPVVKESSDPYLDFRDSMLQMIVEMEIYAWEDLRDLLHRFLALNSPGHHNLILRAFAEIWNGLFSPSSTSPQPSASAARLCRR